MPADEKRQPRLITFSWPSYGARSTPFAINAQVANAVSCVFTPNSFGVLDMTGLVVDADKDGLTLYFDGDAMRFRQRGLQPRLCVETTSKTRSRSRTHCVLAPGGLPSDFTHGDRRKSIYLNDADAKCLKLNITLQDLTSSLQQISREFLVAVCFQNQENLHTPSSLTATTR